MKMRLYCTYLLHSSRRMTHVVFWKRWKIHKLWCLDELSESFHLSFSVQSQRKNWCKKDQEHGMNLWAESFARRSLMIVLNNHTWIEWSHLNLGGNDISLLTKNIKWGKKRITHSNNTRKVWHDVLNFHRHSNISRQTDKANPNPAQQP